MKAAQAKEKEVIFVERILVIGCPGAGKSSFARRLREITGLPLHYLDMIWHRPDRTTVAREEFDRRLEQILQTDRWIIDGNYQRTMARRLEECDAVFLLDIPVEICLEGAKERIGRQRVDLPWVENELDEEFRQWIEEFPARDLPQIRSLLEQYAGRRQIVVFRSRQEMEQYLDQLAREQKK